MSDEYVKGKNKNQLLSELKDTAYAGSQVHEQMKAGILVRSVEDIEKALAILDKTIDGNAKSNDKLSRRIFWLNVILTLATVAGSIISGIALFCK